MTPEQFHSLPAYSKTGFSAAMRTAAPVEPFVHVGERVGAGLRFTLPYPPSANRYWRKTRTGKVYVSAEAKHFKSRVMLLCGRMKPLAGELAVSMTFYRPTLQGDLDNRIKVAIDSLNGLAWSDDKQVGRISAERFLDRKNPRLEITVTPRTAPSPAAPFPSTEARR